MAATAGSPVIVIGPGNESCGVWVESRRTQDERMNNFSAWLAGYLSAVNQHAGDKDILSGRRLEDARLYIDGYCRNFPLRTVKHAADALVETLRSS